jgi:hypothetical protein
MSHLSRKKDGMRKKIILLPVAMALMAAAAPSCGAHLTGSGTDPIGVKSAASRVISQEGKTIKIIGEAEQMKITPKVTMTVINATAPTARALLGTDTWFYRCGPTMLLTVTGTSVIWFGGDLARAPIVRKAAARERHLSWHACAVIENKW